MILDILNKIAATDSTNEKLAILKLNANRTNMQDVYRLAYHPRLQYGIKKVPDYIVQGSDTETTLDQVLHILEHTIAARKVTGHAAIALLSESLAGLPEADAIVVERIIKRDLECGASSTIANKVWKNLIPKQPQMLASAMSEKALAEIKYPAYAQLKADGARCFAEIRGETVDDVKLLSRAGNEYLGLDLIKQELINRTKAYRSVHGSVMVDGELVYFAQEKTGTQAVGLDWMFDNVEVQKEELKPNEKKVVALRSESNGIANKSLKGTIGKQEAASMSFQIWDLVPLDVVYGEVKSSINYEVRFNLLSEIFADSRQIVVIENTIVNNVEEAKAIYKEYVAQGLEGIILKNIDSLWENKRSKNLVKFKEEIIIDLRVVGIQPHSKDPSKLGAIFVESDDRKIKVRCGSGFTDTNAVKVKGEWIPIPFDELDELNRTKLMSLEDEVIGRIVEIKCNGWISAEGRKDSVSLFLPIIMSFRNDKDETNIIDDVFPEASKYLENLE